MSATRTPKRSAGRAALFLGVDGGGSKTQAVLVDARGVVRGRGAAGSSNFRAIGVEQALVHLCAALEEALASGGARPVVESAWFGLAGVHGADDADLLASQLHRFARELQFTNDAELALAGLGSGPGVALIAGTGSIALSRDASGRMTQVGGWGHLLGDEGSAYDIGRRAAQAATRAADGRGRPTELLQLVLQRWDLATPRSIIDHVYLTQEKAHIAALAPGALAIARRGDRVAGEIRRQACAELAMAAITAIDTLKTAEPVPLALGGGLLIHEPDLRKAIVARIRRKRALGRVTVVTEPALWAARSLAARARALS
jgi:N-acetylglucosamine kinase-like BadF-type ATPase